MNPYREPSAPTRLVKLPNEHTYIRVEDVVGVEERSSSVVLLFRHGVEMRWDTKTPGELAEQIATAINHAP